MALRTENKLVAGESQPLYAVISPDDPTQTIFYTVDATRPEPVAESDEEALRAVLALAGVWSDLDWDEAAAALYDIGHCTPPTPPIDDESLGLA